MLRAPCLALVDGFPLPIRIGALADVTDDERRK